MNNKWENIDIVDIYINKHYQHKVYMNIFIQQLAEIKKYVVQNGEISKF